MHHQTFFTQQLYLHGSTHGSEVNCKCTKHQLHINFSEKKSGKRPSIIAIGSKISETFSQRELLADVKDVNVNIAYRGVKEFATGQKVPLLEIHESHPETGTGITSVTLTCSTKFQTEICPNYWTPKSHANQFNYRKRVGQDGEFTTFFEKCSNNGSIDGSENMNSITQPRMYKKSSFPHRYVSIHGYNLSRYANGGGTQLIQLGNTHAFQNPYGYGDSIWGKTHYQGPIFWSNFLIPVLKFPNFYKNVTAHITPSQNFQYGSVTTTNGTRVPMHKIKITAESTTNKYYHPDLHYTILSPRVYVTSSDINPHELKVLGPPVKSSFFTPEAEIIRRHKIFENPNTTQEKIPVDKSKIENICRKDSAKIKKLKSKRRTLAKNEKFRNRHNHFD